MKLRSISLHRIKIPFKREFTHANAARQEADNILIRCETMSGAVGWGETIAREYVTGETTEGTFARIAELPAAYWRGDFNTPEELSGDRLPQLREANVARCAIELALLDARARERNLPLYELLAGLWPRLARIRRQEALRYDGPFGLGSAAASVATAIKLRAYGFAAVKLKMTNDLPRERTRLRLARQFLGDAVDIRVDANEAWTLPQALSLAPLLRRYRVSAVEQPVSKHDRRGMLEFAQRSGCTVIADESLCSQADARAFADSDARVMFAVKLAKLGGFKSTLEVLRLAERRSIAIQIGCQVGESAILSAAGRHLAALCPNLRYLEGSHDRFLLSDNVSREDITFGRGGYAPLLRGPGLGIEVLPGRVEQLTLQKLVLFERAAA